MADLKDHRRALRLSLLSLSHKASVSRFRLWASEQGTLTLTAEEERRIRDTLDSEFARLRDVFRTIGSATERCCEEER
jgi:predicted transcriptional regulator